MGKFFISNGRQIMDLHLGFFTSLLIQHLKAIHISNGHDGALGFHRAAEAASVKFAHGVALFAAGTLREDQERRDFTINAMSFSLQKENFGELVDPFDGLGDISRKLIRTPLDPDTTYSDDPLRMIRAIRFASQLSFDILPESFESIKRNRGRLSILSIERINEELNKILLSPKPSVGLKLMDDATLLELILPQVTNLKGVETVDGRGHKDNFYHSL